MKMYIGKRLLSVLLTICLLLHLSVPIAYADLSEKTITNFEALADNVKNLSVPIGTTELDVKAQMPTSLLASYVNSTTSSAISIAINNITWELDAENSDSADFSSDTAGASFTYIPILPSVDGDGDALSVEPAIELPRIAVEIIEAARTPITELWIGATRVVSGGNVYTTSGTGWSYNSNTYTLTLNGANILEVAPKDQIDYHDFDESINLYGIYCIGDLDIINTGTSIIDIREAFSSRSTGINVNGKIEISGNGTLKFAGLSGGIRGNGLILKGDVELECVTGKENAHVNFAARGISIFGDIIVTERVHLIVRINSSNDNIGLYLLQGNMDIGSEARVSINGGFSGTGDNKGINAVNSQIIVNGKLIAETGDAQDRRRGSAIYLSNSTLKVLGAGSVEARAGNPGSTSGFGIYGVNAQSGSSISIDGGGFLASGGSGAIYPYNTQVTISEPPVFYEISPNKDGSNPTTYSNVEEWANVNGKFETTKYIRATTIYDVYVNDVQVTRLNSHDVLGDGTVSYSRASGGYKARVSLNGASFDGEIKLDDETEILLSGENRVGSISSEHDISIGGNGAINISGDIDFSSTSLILGNGVTLTAEGNIIAGTIIQNGILVNDGIISIIDSFTGDGAAVNNGKLILPLSVSIDAVKKITGDGLNEIKGDGSSPSLFYSNGSKLVLIDSEIDFSNEDNADGGWKLNASLHDDGYQWNASDRTLTIKNMLLQPVDKAMTVPNGAIILLEGTNIIMTENHAGIAGEASLTIAGEGTLRIDSQNSPCITVDDEISILGGVIKARSNERAIAVRNSDDNSGIRIGNLMRVTTPVSPIAIAQSSEIVVVPKLEQEPLVITEIASKVYGDNEFILEVSGGSGIGDVTFTSSNTDVLRIEGSKAIIIKSGETFITAYKASDGTYLETISDSKVISIGRRVLHIKADDKIGIIRGSNLPTFTYIASGLANGDTYTSPVINASVENTLVAGEYAIEISGGALTNSASYNVEYESGILKIINPPSNSSGTDNSEKENSSGGASGGGYSGGGSSNQSVTQVIGEMVNEVKKIEITTDFIAKLVNEGSDVLSVKSGDVNFDIDIETLKLISEQLGAEAFISASRADTSQLSETAKNRIGNRPVYEFLIADKNGKRVTNFGNGKIKISIPYSLIAGERAENLSVFYIDENGNLEEIPNSIYDTQAGLIIFETKHFSKYAVGYNENPIKVNNSLSGSVNTIFNDINNHWAKEDIKFVSEKGFFSGTGKDVFSPNLAITRGMLITVLGKMENIDVSQYNADIFMDVKSDAYYRKYINWAWENGIISGISKNSFAPDMLISREQMAVMVANYIKMSNMNLPNVHAEKIFDDNQEISLWACDSVKQVQMMGIISGKPDNKFDPKSTATRAEASVIIKKLYELMSN